jgi:hypothetical protein
VRGGKADRIFILKFEIWKFKRTWDCNDLLGHIIKDELELLSGISLLCKDDGGLSESEVDHNTFRRFDL